MFDEKECNALSLELQGVEAPADPFRGVFSNRLEAALQYTSAGLKIFPCEPGAKRPARGTHGFKDATTEIRPLDDPRLRDLGWYDFILPDGSELTVTPRDNWAIEPGPAGYTVIDIDPKNGGEETWAALIAKHGPIDTRQVRTPSGGRHLWFRGTITAVNKKLGAGIDTRCFGGYVLLPPSSVKGKLYEWVDETVPIVPLPEWVEREILEAQDEHPRKARPQKAWDAFDDDPEDSTAFEEWKAAGGDGGRFEFLLSRIGDEASGGEGLYNPMVSAAGHGVRLGMALDEVVERIEQVALEAPRGKRTEAYIKEKVAELRRAVRKFRWQDREKDREAETDNDGATQGDASQKEVAEEPRPFWKPSAARTEVSEQVWQFLQDPQRQKLLLRVTPASARRSARSKRLSGP